MKNQNSVIKNYILSSEILILNDNEIPAKLERILPSYSVSFDNYLYQKPLMQNTDYFYSFPLKT